jgi:hypothetical protein
MILLTKVDRLPDTECPSCHAVLTGVIYEDSDNLQIHRHLTDEQMTPDGFYASSSWGECPHCEEPIAGAMVTMVDADVDDDFREDYLWLNADRGQPTIFRADTGERTWWVERYESPKGYVFDNIFGPFPGSPLDRALMWGTVTNVWDELRAISRMR